MARSTAKLALVAVMVACAVLQWPALYTEPVLAVGVDDAGRSIRAALRGTDARALVLGTPYRDPGVAAATLDALDTFAPDCVLDDEQPLDRRLASLRSRLRKRAGTGIREDVAAWARRSGASHGSVYEGVERAEPWDAAAQRRFFVTGPVERIGAALATGSCRRVAVLVRDQDTGVEDLTAGLGEVGVSAVGVAWVRDVSVHRLDRDTVERYRDHRMREGASPRTIVQERRGGPDAAPSGRVVLAPVHLRPRARPVNVTAGIRSAAPRRR